MQNENVLEGRAAYGCIDLKDFSQYISARCSVNRNLSLTALMCGCGRVLRMQAQRGEMACWIRVLQNFRKFKRPRWSWTRMLFPVTFQIWLPPPKRKK